MRASRSRGLRDSAVGGGAGAHADDGAVEDDEEAGWLGEYGSREFRFAQMVEHGVDIAVVGGNVRGEEEGDSDEGGRRVEEWWQWIGENL